MLIKNMLVPYTDVCVYPPIDITTAPVKNFILGFIVADKDNEPSWGGYYKITSNHYIDVIKKVRSNGGDVIVSFGGAVGNEIATSEYSDEKLFLKYKAVVDRYDLKAIDLDIEGEGLKDLKACNRRAKAILELRNIYPNLEVTMTVPVMPTGLSKDVLNCMKSTPHDILNIMAMDFGNESNMAKAVIEALQSTRLQTKKKIAVTVMIGQNDTREIFTLQNAKVLKQYVLKNPWIVRVSFWSLERDEGLFGPLHKSSQIKQKRWEFSNLLS